MIPVELEINEAAALLEPAGSSVVPDNIRLGVYRIAELAMGNVAKHAEATVCSVGWLYDEVDQNLIMTVSDDGKRFDPAVIRQTGLGMVNIGDYADAMNASLEITSQPGMGTKLKLIIPFVPPAVEQGLKELHTDVAADALGDSGEQPSLA